LSSDALRHGFREVFRDPALLLIEIAWRWTFGVIAVFVCAISLFALLGSITVDPQRFETLRVLSPMELAQTVAATLMALGVAFIRVGIITGLALAICWAILSALGRYATLARPALMPGATLKTCFAISTVRALTTMICILLWIVATFFAGLLGGAAGHGPAPNVLLMAAILLPTSALLVIVWSISNWYLSLGHLVAEETWTGSVMGAWKLTKLRGDDILEISIATAGIRYVLLIAAVMLSFAVSTVITNPRVLLADLLAISLLYFFCADFVYVARLGAYSRLRPLSEAESRMRFGACGSSSRSGQIWEVRT
jgi:hypothetical protein